MAGEAKKGPAGEVAVLHYYLADQDDPGTLCVRRVLAVLDGEKATLVATGEVLSRGEPGPGVWSPDTSNLR